MLTSFFVVLAAALLAAALLGWAAYSRRFGWAALGATIGLGLVLTITCVFWQQAVLIAAISSVVFLGVGVMLQKVEPAKALTGAAAAIVLFFVFTWMAVQLAEIFFFEHDVGFAELLDAGLRYLGAEFYWSFEQTLLAVGLACLISSVFVEGWPRTLSVFLGAFLLALIASQCLADLDILYRTYPAIQDPIVQLMLVLVIAAIVLRALQPPGKSRRP